MKEFFHSFVHGITRLAGTVLALLLVSALILYALRLWQTSRIPDSAVLVLDLNSGIIESIPQTLLAQVLYEDTPSVLSLVEALDAAARDARVTGLIARVGDAPIGIAQAQELRDAVMRFRRSGKPAIAFTESFGEFGPGTISYYLATAFDEIHIQPSGSLGLTGLVSETLFFRDALDELRVTPRLDSRKEYKTFRNMFTENGYTPEHAEAIRTVLDSLFSQILDGIVTQRGLDPATLGQLIDRGLLSAQEALEHRLVDGLLYREDVVARMEQLAGTDVALFDLLTFHRLTRTAGAGDAIALIYCTGPIVYGRSDFDPVVRRIMTGSDTLLTAFTQAEKDSSIKAILFRIDSPGGSYIAADTVWQEIMRIQKTGTPVIVSMSTTAASGGYYVAMPAQCIVAHPGTITGSIGVVGGKMVVDGFLQKYGITARRITAGRQADMWSMTTDYTPGQWQLLQSMLDRIYRDFVEKAARGRAMSETRIRDSAKGRIWTGADARTRGLVDELGGFAEALQQARQAAGIEENETVHLKVFPQAHSLAEWFMQYLYASPVAVSIVQALAGPFLAPLHCAEHLGPLRQAGEVCRPPRPLQVQELQIR